MKTTVQFAVLLLFGILFTVTSCTKDKHMAGEHKDWNVLEWTVDGERYKAECEGDPLFGCDPVDCQYYHDSMTLEFYGSSLEYGAIEVYKYKNIILNSSNNILGMYDILTFYGDNSDCNAYQADSTLSYSFKINSIDTLQKVIEGSFAFSAVNNCRDTVMVEDGYFKLSYRP